MAKRVRADLRGIAFTEKNGHIRVIAEDAVVPDNDPAVKAHPEWFVDYFDDPRTRAASVEQATAAPGEHRNR